MAQKTIPAWRDFPGKTEYSGRAKLEGEHEVMMTITVEIPDLLASVLAAEGKDPARAALEAMALEGYRTERLTEADLKDLLGFETRMEVHGFLKDHGAFLHYTAEDLEHDTAVAIEAARRHKKQSAGTPPGQHTG